MSYGTQTTLAEHYVIEPGNMSRYELLFLKYTSSVTKRAMCAITWLNRERGGKTFVWPEGDTVYASYAIEKSQISIGDIAPILKDVERRWPGSLTTRGLDEFDEYGRWVGTNGISSQRVGE